MGYRGPAPTPSAIKKVKGNPGRRPMNSAEPSLPPGVPDCPEHLDDVARREWARVANLLVGMKVLTEADYIALGTLCQAYSTLIEAQKQMNKTGILYKTKSGYVQQSPLLGIITAQTAIVHKMLCEFGLTPASRSRINVAPQEEKPKNKFAMLGGAEENFQPSVQ